MTDARSNRKKTHHSERDNRTNNVWFTGLHIDVDLVARAVNHAVERLKALVLDCVVPASVVGDATLLTPIEGGFGGGRSGPIRAAIRPQNCTTAVLCVVQRVGLPST